MHELQSWLTKKLQEYLANDFLTQFEVKEVTSYQISKRLPIVYGLCQEEQVTTYRFRSRRLAKVFLKKKRSDSNQALDVVCNIQPTAALEYFNFMINV